MARMLALTARLPYPPREGHQLRSWHILRAAARAHDVTLLSFQRDDDAPLDQCGPLRDMLAGLETFPVAAQHSHAALLRALVMGVVGTKPFVAEKYACAQMRDRATEVARQSDLVHVDILPLMPLLDGMREAIPVVLNAHNVEHALLRQRAEVERGWAARLFLRTQVAKLARFERDACRRADHVLACSADDARQVSALAPDTPVSIVPNGVDTASIVPARGAAAQRVSIVFVGQMAWFPNRDGMEWFLAEIFPRILAQRPDAQFVHVGKSDGFRVPAALRPSVRLAGFVEDLAPIVADATVVVVPLRAGSGTRLKVLEAMAFAKPIVTTHVGAEGIDLAPGREALFADDAPEFAEAVLHLIANPGDAAHMGRAAREKAQATYDWGAIGATALSAYARALQSTAEVNAGRAAHASGSSPLQPVRGSPLRT